MGATYFDPEQGEWFYEDQRASLPDYGYLELFQQAHFAGQLESCARNREPDLLVPDLIDDL